MASGSLTTQIQDASRRNRELLAILAETDHAAPDLEQHRRHLADLEAQLQQSKKHIRQLDANREKEFKEHKTYRDSVLRRFAYKASGNREKFEARAAKEEREYFEALQEEHKAKAMDDNLEALKQEALAAKGNLETQAARHGEAQRELDSLYDSIFQGPTPGFPEEDARESQSAAALQSYHDARVRSEAETQALGQLQEAARNLGVGMMCVEEALSHSRFDMFGGGTLADMMERDALHRAEMAVMRAQQLVSQAQRYSPAVQSLPPVAIAHGSIISDVVFDNIFTDMAFHDKIKASREEMRRCVALMGAQVEACRARQREFGALERVQAENLEAARTALQKARQEIFERLGAGEANEGPAKEATT
ncbi:hypothetical protein BX600DRAFT_454336 [Xylariales sp. PMI_506]|nr:hypothetical protein BX600DRAFT_454336 [Xylariales sp. PMI_506]